MAWLFLKLHALVIWVVWGGLRLAGRAVWSFVLAVFALLGEEFQRYAGLTVWGVLIVLGGKMALHAPAGVRQPLLLTVLLLLGIWALALRRATKVTRANNLVKVRQRQAFRELKGEVAKTRGAVVEGLARRTRGTRGGRAFRSNREAEDAAAEQAAREQRAAEADEARRDELAALEPDPY